MQSQKIFVSTLISLLVIGVSFFAGYAVRGRTTDIGHAVPVTISNDTSGKPEMVDFTPFWAIWNTLDQKFVGASTTERVTDQEKVWGAMQGLANSYGDPYTAFLPPQDSEIFNETINGNFGGVGMEIGMRDNTLTVIAPLKNTPAFHAGIKAGDKVILIDGEATAGESIESSVQKIRGEVGTSVTLTIVRDGVDEPFEVAITRDAITIPTLDTEITPEGVFVISLYNFSAPAPNVFREALREFVNSNSDKLLLDLRGNPGGFLEAAIDMTSWFLPSGKVIVREDFGEGVPEKVHRSYGYDIFNDQLKMVILIDQGSASASEIMAGALKEQGVATLIGMRSFGKGSVQEVVPVTDNTTLKVTVAQWLTPDGHSISSGGLIPDIEVRVTPEDIESGIDPQRVRAVRFLLEGN